jgi:polyhydroxyalkanoate synthesis regulator phasin
MNVVGKKQAKEPQAEQSERFRNDVRQMIADGELNPTEADSALDALVRSSKNRNNGGVER